MQVHFCGFEEDQEADRSGEALGGFSKGPSSSHQCQTRSRCCFFFLAVRESQKTYTNVRVVLPFHVQTCGVNVANKTTHATAWEVLLVSKTNILFICHFSKPGWLDTSYILLFIVFWFPWFDSSFSCHDVFCCQFLSKLVVLALLAAIFLSFWPF